MKTQILCILVLLLVLSSCGYGKFIQTEEKGDTVDLFSENSDLHQLRMDDKITVSVWGHNDVSLGSIYSIYSVSESFGKWVLIDSSGYVNLPKLGQVHLEGLSCDAAGKLIADSLRKDLVDPIVVVKVLNKEVTLLGEVKTQGNYLLDKEHTTVKEIIGKAEGFLQYANTEKVHLVRNDTVYIMDLSVHNGLENIHVKADDLIYVPARKGKNFDLSIKRIIPFASAITAVAVFSTLFN